jgi:F-type H+-transporting ATPase subunit b
MATVLLGIDALGFNIPALLAQLINFGILLLVFSVFLYRPLMKVLDERKQRIQEGLEASEESKRQLSRTEEEVAKELAKARERGQTLIGEAQQMSQRIQNEAREAARAEAEQLLERARTEIGLERDAAIADLRREFADLTITAAERVIKQSLDKDQHRQLIEEVLAEAPSASGNGGGGTR